MTSPRGTVAGLTGWLSRAYRNEVELSMAAAACLPMGEDHSGSPEVIVERCIRMFRESLVGAR
jgi:hypothetical protein